MKPLMIFDQKSIIKNQARLLENLAYKKNLELIENRMTSEWTTNRLSRLWCIPGTQESNQTKN